MFNLNKEKLEKGLEKAQAIALKTVKYGAVFTSGVLLGTLCGFILFFKISGDTE